jgi:transposase InsO family protein
MEKVTLTNEDRTAYQLTLQDDYSRAYTFCDLYREPTVNTTIGAMIATMWEYQTIPKAVVFDNGPTFSGRRLSAFCLNLDIRLIYTSVRHPQTNGKLERAFRDDMDEFYRQHEKWIFGELRRSLPKYVHYRNHIRGHLALGGKPSISRLQEQDWFALPSVLGQLEEYACYRIGKRTLDEVGGLRVLGRTAVVGYRLRRQEITL